MSQAGAPAASARPETQSAPSDRVLADRILTEIAELSPDTRGVSRPAYSAIETRALDRLLRIAVELGLSVRTDAAQNRVFALPGDDDPEARHILIGSHVDTVPQGGNFDGLAGVVAGLVLLHRVFRDALATRLPVRVIAMRGEESAWFGSCYLSSKLLTGAITEEELAARHRGDDRPLSDHMSDVGISDAAPGRALGDLGCIAEYLELHIEQGPLLVERGVEAAVVTGIRGNFRHRAVRCTGQAGHSGAVPRAYRHDPVMAFAELMHRLDETWESALNEGEDLVLTCGILGTDSAEHAISRIPGEVTFSLDIRSQSEETLTRMRARLRLEMDEIAARRGVRFDLGPEIHAAPAMMNDAVTAALMGAMKASGKEAFSMPSGGGHDAAIFARAGVPAGMLFVRNTNGSHNPEEAMETSDLVSGIDILTRHVTG